MMYRLTPLLLMLLTTSAAAQHHAASDARTNPHPHDPVLRAEHLAMLALVSPEAATHRAIHNGTWANRGTWANGKIPAAGAKVWIPRGITVTLDQVLTTAHRTIRVDGTLRFDPAQDTSLIVDTLVVAPFGRLVIGTKEQPIAADKTASIIFSDEGPIDSKWDPELLSRGLISHGATEIHGAAKTSFLPLAQPPRKGATKLLLSQSPVNWNKGDHLVLTGTEGYGQDEELTILALAGKVITVAPLKFDHITPKADLVPYVGNLTRNIILRSQNRKDANRLGHVMFMHSADVALRNAAFHDLGRTDKRIRIDDPKLDKQGRLMAGTGRNPRGRYAVHFHRTGIDRRSSPILVRGCAVVDSPGWGFVNHSSYVHFEDNVAYNVHGAAFVSEAGDEIGAFRHNLAVHSLGTNEDIDARRNIADFGHEGDGFWFQGGGVEVENNVAAGQRNTGFVFFTEGLLEEGLGSRRFPTTNLPDRSWGRGQATVEVGHVPIRLFRNNTVFASGMGIMTRFHLIGVKHPGRSVLEGGVIWNTRIGIRPLYSHRITLRNMRLINRGYIFDGISGAPEETGEMIYENLHVEGWGIGLAVPLEGSQRIEGGYYDNKKNILISTPFGPGRTIEINKVRFGTSSGKEQWNILMGSNFSNHFGHGPGPRGINLIFEPNATFLQEVSYEGQQLYYPEQASDYVPFKPGVVAPRNVPRELIGKTNQEMWEKYGLALAGMVAPRDAHTAPGIRGLIGSRAKYPLALTLLSGAQVNNPDRYKLVVRDAKGRIGAAWLRPEFHPGWNILTREFEGRRRSFLIYNGQWPPR